MLLEVRVALTVGIALALVARPDQSTARCDGRAGAWIAMNAKGGPAVSNETPLVTVGGRIFVFGAAGAIFDPCANRWAAMSKAGLPDGAWSARYFRPLIVGDRVVFLGVGNNGEVPFAAGGVTALVYNVARNRWSTVADQPDAFAWRRGPLIVATDREVIVWGGVVEANPGRGGAARLLDDGARLDPMKGTWRPMARKDAPSGRSHAQAVWMGTRLVVWGGIGTRTNPYQCSMRGDCRPTAGGGVYDLAADAWSAMSEADAPSARSGAAVKRVGDTVVVWGGVDRPNGALYDPVANSWRALPPPPPAIEGSRLDDFSLTVGAGKIVVVTNRRQAAVYDLAGARWTAVPDIQFPVGLKDLRDLGNVPLQLIIDRSTPNAPGVGTLARVNAEAARWELAPLPAPSAPASLESGIVVWADDRLLVWGPRYQQVHYEADRAHPKDCGPRQPGQPICDPAIPVREVRIGRGGQEGGLLRPVFSAVAPPAR